MIGAAAMTPNGLTVSEYQRPLTMAFVRYDSRWFRGEPQVPTRLVPKLYRTQPYPNENQLLENFRSMAPSFASRTPMRTDTDQWV